jgi:F-type H+-transporting ATPase subunit b
MSSQVLAAEGNSNFLLPNGTFFAELIIFAIVLMVVWRYVLPPVQRALKERHDMVQRQLDESHEAVDKFRAAEERYREALAEARAESGRIREEARAEGQRIIEDMRERAQSEVADIQRRGEEQLAARREEALRDLRSQVGPLATTLAGRVLAEDVSADPGHRETVDRFLQESGGGS